MDRRRRRIRRSGQALIVKLPWLVASKAIDQSAEYGLREDIVSTAPRASSNTFRKFDNQAK
jgi:hypothetical protein